jgi:hypothetical protein
MQPLRVISIASPFECDVEPLAALHTGLLPDG